jgi:SPP1 gp7 family putative phage head morphogenesis protein
VRKVKPSPRRASKAERSGASIVKGGALRLPPTAAARYNRQLQKLIGEMYRATHAELTKLFTSPVAVESHVATDASIASQSRILTNALIDRFSVLFARAAKGISESMIDEVQTNSATGLRNSLRDIAGNVTLKTDVLTSGPVADTITASVAENVSLIKSIPQKFLEGVQGAVMRSITSGNGLADLDPYLKDQKGITERRARNIALDQTRKAYNAINKSRMQGLGVSKFEWIHTGGSQKPRQDHIDMSGEIYSFDDPPVIDQRTGERGIPGQAPNCRCTMRPILDFGEE